MRHQSTELFKQDLKFLVDANPRRRTRVKSHSHWLGAAVITGLVGIWFGSEPSASISVSPAPDFSASREISQISKTPAFEGNGDTVVITSPAMQEEAHDPVTPPLESLQTIAVPGIEFGPHARIIPTPERIEETVLEVESPVESTLEPTLELYTDFEDLQQDLELFEPNIQPALEMPGARDAGDWVIVDIKKGDTLSKLFQRHGVPREITHNLSRSEKGKKLNSLRTGPHLRLRFNSEGQLTSLRYNVDAVKLLIAEFDGAEFKTRFEERKVEVRQREVAGSISGSLFQSAAKAGLSDRFVMHLVSIFKWNIDFNRDLQPGDRFSVIFEEKFVGGKKFATGGIVAAAFIVNGRKYTAIRNVDTDGHVSYFNAEGESLKRAFLRSPVKFSRISSQFSKRRYHPILKKWKAHKGVDYAASRGTPVYSTADGVVEFLGTKGGYGRTVVVRHGKQYQTLYSHLNGYNKKIRRGSRVKQGQVIGYVGSTGLATGPHLHYEFRVNGVHKNPLTVKAPRALPIDGKQRRAFMKVASVMDQRLTSLIN